MNARVSLTPALQPIILDAPYSKVHVDHADADDHVHMRARQLAELLELMEPAEGAGPMLWLAQQLAKEIIGTLSGGGAA